jgi:exoribonuclease R
MVRNRWRPYSPTSTEVRKSFEAARAEAGIQAAFPPEALAEAEEAAKRVPGPEYQDRRDIEFVTIDPASSLDLDQAVEIERRNPAGYRVHYAIADLGFFVDPGSALDAEVNRRGMTVYGPDQRIPLHPPVLSEGAASLLPDQDRPAALWTIDLDAAGEITNASVKRALVRSRAKLSYEDVQKQLDDGSASESLQLLREVGLKRQEIERKRGGVSMEVPEQEVEEDIDGDFNLTFRKTLPVEGWNAQISLLTGIAAAHMMRKKHIGILRTLPPADPRDIKRLRATARALGINWPKTLSYSELLRGLNSDNPKHAAFMNAATTLFRGAGYEAFDNEAPTAQIDDAIGMPLDADGQVEQDKPTGPPGNQHAAGHRSAGFHSAIAAQYSHVTAPLRRLVDRYGTEICLAQSAGRSVPDWVRAQLPVLPEEMATTGRVANKLERRGADVVEAALMQDRIGEVFDGVVVDLDYPRGKPSNAEQNKLQRGQVMISDPAILAKITGEHLELGEPVKAKLVSASIPEARVLFEAV